MATPLLVGMAAAGAAWASRAAILALSRTGVASATGRAGVRFPRAFAGGFEEEMSRKEALNILGLREGAQKDVVRKAHLKLMRLNHPDTGGSQYVATKVNEAKDQLLSGKRGGRVI